MRISTLVLIISISVIVTGILAFIILPDHSINSLSTEFILRSDLRNKKAFTASPILNALLIRYEKYFGSLEPDKKDIPLVRSEMYLENTQLLKEMITSDYSFISIFNDNTNVNTV